jgi:Flp pilus assembly protein TadG
LRTHSRIRQLGNSRGQTLIEFAVSVFLLVMLLLGVFEISRMILVYTTVANAARVGARYAIVHGANASPTGTVALVQGVVRNYLSAGPLTSANATINVTGAGGAIGSSVTVQVSYPYNPLVTYFPLTANLGSVSQGVITF